MMVKLGDVATYINGYAFKPSDWSENGLPIIRIQDLTGNSYQCNRYNGEYDKKYEIIDGDVLISWSASLGVYVWKGEKAVLNQHIFKVLFDKCEVHKNFFVHQAVNILEKAESSAHGATMKHLTKKVFDSLPFYLPPLEEQRKIAETLDKVSDLITKRKQQLEKLDLLVQSKFVEMFGDPILNNKGWTIRKVIEECDCMVPGRDKPKTFTGDIPWITIDDLCLNGVTYKSKQNLGLTQEEIDSVNRKAIPKNSVIMSCVGNLGICSIAGTDMVINQQLHSFQCHSSLNNIYLMYYLGQRKDYMNQQATSTTVLYMNKSVCNSIPTMIPPIELQNQFADFVQQTEKTKTIINQSLEKLETLKKALMQEYFS